MGRNARRKVPKHQSRWKPHELLLEAHNHGVPLWNGGQHVLQFIRSVYHYLTPGKKFFDELKHLLNWFPVVGVIPVHTNFSDDGSDVYTKINDEVRYEQLSTEMEKTVCYHAIVIIDFLEIEGNLYFAYQNSQGDPSKSMCKLGVSWLEAELVREIHYGCNQPPFHPPGVLQTQQQIADTRCFINTVRQVSTVLEESLLESRTLIEKISKSNEKCSANVQAWNKKVKDHIEKLLNLAGHMQNFALRFKCIHHAAIPDVHDIPRLLEACQKADLIATKAYELQSLHKTAMI